MNKLPIILAFILPGLSFTSVYGQDEMFLVNKKYLDNLSSGYTTGLIEVACMAIRIRVDGSNIKVREYYSTDNYGWISSSDYNTYTYVYDSNSNSFRLKCGKSEGSGLLGHTHTDGGYHWIKVDEFGDFLLLKNCGTAKLINKFVIANPANYMR